MKNYYLYRWITIICLILLQVKVTAQINVSIQILPPYPTKFTDYASKPHLMVISVTNTSTANQKVQLRGLVTGDNGIAIRVKPGYKSPTALELSPGQTRMLNGNDISYFFKYDQLEYSGITQNDFINKGGLPEGRYQLCIRAYDYDNNAPLSAEEPSGCSNSFSISSLEPPVILSPMDQEVVSSQAGQILSIRWNTPVSTPPNIRYKIRMVEILGNKNPNDALMTARQPYFFEKEVMTNMYVYTPADPQLTPGRSYALMVEAFDPTNTAVFRNQGRSEVTSFTYGTTPEPIANIPEDPSAQINPIIASIPDCGSCKITAPAGSTSNSSVTVGKEIKVGNFTMKVVSVKSSANKLNGEGTINLPFIGSNTPGARLKVQFSDLEVNSSLQMKSGLVSGVIANSASSFIPNNSSETTAPTPQQSAGLGDYFVSNANHTLQNIKNNVNAAGFELPIGLSTGPTTIAITRMYFNAQQAWFEAAGAVGIPEEGTVLGLSGKNMCLSATDLCKNGTLHLTENFNIPALKMVLRKPGTNPITDPGTSITFNKDGFVNLTVDADYTFPQEIVVNAQTRAALTARLTATKGNSWTDWVAELSLPKFNIAGIESLGFDLAGRKIYYDHSDFSNPQNIPPIFTSADAGESPINTSLPTWQGVFIPQIAVTMPEIIKSVSGVELKIEGKNMIIDANGFTGTVQNSVPVIELADGSMDGWYASIEHVKLNIFKSAFKSSEMTGKVVLPSITEIRDQKNQLDYIATLTTPTGSGLSYNFIIAPKNNLVINALFMEVNLDSRTQITASGGGGQPLTARASLNGELSISNDPLSKIKIPGVGKLSLPGVKFENLIFTTTSPFIDKTGLNIKLASNQKKLAGFDFSAKSNGWELNAIAGGVKIALPFEGNISLAGEALGCEANAVFALTSEIVKDDKRIIWKGLGGEIRDVSFGAGVDLGAFSLKGAIKYYNKNPGGSSTDEGFVGALQTNLAGFLTLNMRGRFGTMSDAQGDFNYYDFNALADFGPTGLTFAPPIPLALYGFGGGFSHNMGIAPNSIPDKNKVNGSQQIQPKEDDSPLDLLNYNPAGLVLTPKRGESTLQATILFGLTSRNTLDADATFSMGFLKDGGLKFVKLNGNARILTDISKPLPERRDASTGAADLTIEFDTETHAFTANLGVEFGVPTVNDKSLLYASGETTFFSNGQQWYLKIGSPSNPNKIRFLDFVEGASYFQMGNYQIEPMPELPDWIKNLVGYGGKNQSSKLQTSQDLARNQSLQNRNDSGMIFGASTSFGKPDTKYRFLMFYGEFTAGLGFDFALKDNFECEGVTKSGGAGGWYATGQAYFGARAAVGITVDLFLVKGDFEIFSAGAAAAVKAGFPEPMYAKGALGAQFSILDGMVEGDFNLQFSIGTECINAESRAFGGVEIISQVLPARSSEKVLLNIVPAVVFNLKIGGQFGQYDSYQPGLGMYSFDDYENPTESGMPTRRYFYFDRSCIKVTLNGEDVTNRLARYQGDKKTLYLPTQSHLPNNTTYNLKVVAKMKEAFLDQAAFINSMGGDGSALATFRFIQMNGGDATQEAETEFTTDEGYGSIQAGDYAATWPMHGHTAIPYQESGIEAHQNKMYIETRTVVDNNTYFKYPEGTTYKARIFKNGVKVGADINVDMQTIDTYLNTPYTGHKRAHTRWSWTSQTLSASTDYVALVIAKIPAGNTAAPTVNSVVSRTQYVSTQSLSAGAINTSSNVLSGNINNNELRAGESIVASLAFKTSKYNNYNAKLSDAKISRIVHSEKGGSISSANNASTNLQTLNSWIKPETNGSYNIIFGMGGNLPIDLTLNGEKFNKADVENTSSDQIFLASSENGAGTLVNPGLSPLSLTKLYKNAPFANLGVNDDFLKQYLSDRTGIAKSKFRITYNRVPEIHGNGIFDMWAVTDGGTSFINNFTPIGAVLPGDVPKPQESQTIQSGGLTMQTMYLYIPIPIILERIRSVSIATHSIGMPTFTNPVQIAIDRVTNYGVNWGYNQQQGNPQAGMPNRNSVSTWEGVSQLTTGLITGKSTINQLQNGIQGLNTKGAIR